MEEKIIARHQTMDLYNCKIEQLLGQGGIKTELPNLLKETGFHILASDVERLEPDHVAILLLLKEGHFAIHIYPHIAYVAADLFICNHTAEPEKLVKGIRAIFKPEKLRTTYLKRGDFTGLVDMKPRTKTKIAPLKRINSTGAKVIRFLAHRKHSPLLD
ncbi:MAG: S-adenosylmethionine decarboxylase family protein [Selenomonadaceae bacterium]